MVLILFLYINFVPKLIWPSIYSITSTFDGTDRQTNIDLGLKKSKYKVKVGLSVCAVPNLRPTLAFCQNFD